MPSKSIKESTGQKQKHNIFSGRFIKNDQGQLVIHPDSAVKYKLFVDSLIEGQSINIFMESNVENGNLDQLAKIHACIRELAAEQGSTFAEMKLDIKKAAGFCFEFETDDGPGLYCKSFAHSSREELGRVIQVIIATGQTLNINFD